MTAYRHVSAAARNFGIQAQIPSRQVRDGGSGQPTERQWGFFWTLVEERLTADERSRTARVIGRNMDTYTFDDVSNMISRLMAKPKLNQDVPAPEPVREEQVITGSIPDIGTYTVAMDDNTHRTFKFDVGQLGGVDTTFIAYLSGPDNDNSFTNFANVQADGTVRIWNRFKADSTLAGCLAVLIDSDDDVRKEMGHAYALASGRCWRCRRTLTVPASIHRGLGPDCATKI